MALLVASGSQWWDGGITIDITTDITMVVHRVTSGITIMEPWWDHGVSGGITVGITTDITIGITMVFPRVTSGIATMEPWWDHDVTRGIAIAIPMMSHGTTAGVTGITMVGLWHHHRHHHGGTP